MTITEKIQKLVSNNALQAGFIAQALAEYADKVLANQDEVKKDMANGFIDAESWIQCANEIKQEIR